MTIMFSDNKHANSKDKSLVMLLPIMPQAMRNHNKMPHPTQAYKAKK